MNDFRLYKPGECGKDGYPLKWHEGANGSPHGLKRLVRDLASNRCERCGHPYRCGEHGNGEWTPCDDICRHASNLEHWRPNGKYGEAQWRILTVHHLDGNKANCEEWNLAALCQKCHLTVQGRVKMDQMFFAEVLDVSEWFKPHLAGYLASRQSELAL